ncbi:alpha/beta hydrolase family protein [Melioribacter sp. OK-6-Me]|uniref:alpha/beta hydrolase family protein n=1 Tax=unclassified Melioribacter TaxID=2627329 RepID=UPI003ED9C6B5
MNYDPVVEDPKYYDTEFPSSMLPVVIESYGYKLIGTYFLAAGKGPHPIIILLHGFPGNEVNFDLAHVFHRQGFNVLIFHYRGCWGSQGDYSWENLTRDLESAVNFIKQNHKNDKFRLDSTRIILVGHSMGGFAALYYSIFHDEIKNVVSIAGFNAGAFGELLKINKEIFDLSLEKIKFFATIVKNTSAEKLLGELISNMNEWNLLKYSSKLSLKRLLIIGAKYDTTAPLEIHHLPLVTSLRLAGAEKLEENVLECGHSFADSRIELARIISNWLKKIRF